MAHVCSWRFVHTFDNCFRPWFHNTEKLFRTYVKSGMTVMDIGCGAGFASIGLAKLVGAKGAFENVVIVHRKVAKDAKTMIIFF